MQLSLVLLLIKKQYVTPYHLWSLCFKISFTFKLVFIKFSLAKILSIFYSDKYFLIRSIQSSVWQRLLDAVFICHKMENWCERAEYFCDQINQKTYSQSKNMISKNTTYKTNNNNKNHQKPNNQKNPKK